MTSVRKGIFTFLLIIFSLILIISGASLFDDVNGYFQSRSLVENARMRAREITDKRFLECFDSLYFRKIVTPVCFELKALGEVESYETILLRSDEVVESLKSPQKWWRQLIIIFISTSIIYFLIVILKKNRKRKIKTNPQKAP